MSTNIKTNKVSVGMACKSSNDCISNVCLKGLCQSPIGSEEELIQKAKDLDMKIKKKKRIKRNKKKIQ